MFMKEILRCYAITLVMPSIFNVSTVKEGQQKYCETVYSRSGINHMWILKNSEIKIFLSGILHQNF